MTKSKKKMVSEFVVHSGNLPTFQTFYGEGDVFVARGKNMVEFKSASFDFVRPDTYGEPLDGCEVASEIVVVFPLGKTEKALAALRKVMEVASADMKGKLGAKPREDSN